MAQKSERLPGKASTKDLKYEMFDNKGQRVRPEGIAKWYQVVPISAVAPLLNTYGDKKKK